MFVRVNIPNWGLSEYRAGLFAMLHGSRQRPDLVFTDVLEAATGRSDISLHASARQALVTAMGAGCIRATSIAVPAYVCPAVAHAVRAAGMHPVPIDCATDAFHMDHDALEKAIERDRIGGVIVPSTYGVPAPHERLRSVGLPWFNDAAYRVGDMEQVTASERNGSAATIWSFNYKALSGVGGGILIGANTSVTTREPVGYIGSRRDERQRFANYALRAVWRHRIPRSLPGAAVPRALAKHEGRPVLERVPMGTMSGLQAAIALTQWQRRLELFRRSRSNSSLLADVAARSELVRLPSTTDGAADAGFPHLFPLLVTSPIEQAEATVLRIRKSLHCRGVQTEDPYPLLATQYARIERATELRRRLLLVPCNASIASDAIAHVAEALDCALREV